MQGALSFSYERSGDPEDSPEARILQGYKERLKNIRSLFLYEESVRNITVNNIDILERDLREIVGSIDRLQHVPHVKNLISSPDALQAKVRSAIKCLNLAADILEMARTARNRELLYQKYEEIPEFLCEAIGLFRT